MTNRCVYIALMTDNNYVMPTEVLLKSMYENKKQETIYKIFILCDSLKNNNMVEKLREMTQGNFYVETIKVDNPCKNFINNSFIFYYFTAANPFGTTCSLFLALIQIITITAITVTRIFHILAFKL